VILAKPSAQGHLCLELARCEERGGLGRAAPLSLLLRAGALDRRSLGQGPAACGRLRPKAGAARSIAQSQRKARSAQAPQPPLLPRAEHRDALPCSLCCAAAAALCSGKTALPEALGKMVRGAGGLGVARACGALGLERSSMRAMLAGGLALRAALGSLG
jgi:hypothetical protein